MFSENCTVKVEPGPQPADILEAVQNGCNL